MLACVPLWLGACAGDDRATAITLEAGASAADPAAPFSGDAASSVDDARPVLVGGGGITDGLRASDVQKLLGPERKPSVNTSVAISNGVARFEDWCVDETSIACIESVVLL